MLHPSGRRLAPLLCSLAALLPAAAHAAPAHGFRILYAEPVTFDDVATRADAGARPSQLRTRFDAYGRRFELALERNDRVLGQLATGAGAPQVWRGTLAGVPGSWVRFTVADGRRYGMVWDGRDLYVIEPAADASANFVGPAPASGDAPVVYRLSDTLAPEGGASCAAAHVPGDAHAPPATARTGLAAYTQLVGELQNAAATSTTTAPPTANATATKRLQVSAVADAEYGAANGVTGAQNKIIVRFNNIDGIFANQVGVQIELTSPIRVLDSASQPFNTTDPNTLLDQLGTYRQSLVSSASTSASAGGLTHLVTGRNLDGTTVGIAYIGALCSARYGVSLSEGGGSFADLVAAHEIGHNFGAPHDGEASTTTTNPCYSVPKTFLMAPTINGSNQFSQCSLDQIAPKVAAASCLLPALAPPSVDLAVTSQGDAQGFVQRAVAASVAVANVGTAAASNARATFTIPAGPTVTGGSADSGGTCAVQSGTLVCTWPTLAAGARAIATANLQAGTQPGSYAVRVTSATTGDTNAQNDAATVNVQVLALPSLTVTPPSPTEQVTVGQDLTLRATVGYASGAGDVGGGTVAFELPPVLEPVAPLAGGCTQQGSVVTCPFGTIPSGGSRTVTLAVRGVTAGTGTVRLTLASPDDGSANDNVASVGVTVNAAPAPIATPAPTTAATSGGGGGGGGTGLLDLAALAALLLLRHARRAGGAREIRPAASGRC